MRGRLILGIIDILVGLACFILCIIINRTDRIIMTFLLVAIGVGNVVCYISEKKRHEKKLAELAKKWGTEEDEFGNAYIRDNYQCEDEE